MSNEARDVKSQAVQLVLQKVDTRGVKLLSESRLQFPSLLSVHVDGFEGGVLPQHQLFSLRMLGNLVEGVKSLKVNDSERKSETCPCPDLFHSLDKKEALGKYGTVQHFHAELCPRQTSVLLGGESNWYFSTIQGFSYPDTNQILKQLKDHPVLDTLTISKPFILKPAQAGEQRLSLHVSRIGHRWKILSLVDVCLGGKLEPKQGPTKLEQFSYTETGVIEKNDHHNHLFRIIQESSRSLTCLHLLRSVSWWDEKAAKFSNQSQMASPNGYLKALLPSICKCNNLSKISVLLLDKKNTIKVGLHELTGEWSDFLRRQKHLREVTCAALWNLKGEEILAKKVTLFDQELPEQKDSLSEGLDSIAKVFPDTRYLHSISLRAHRSKHKGGGRPSDYPKLKSFNEQAWVWIEENNMETFVDDYAQLASHAPPIHTY
ncbi:hypothetical protein T439DRAFT_373952 [Meredithblackwellia eburnea MCA 4105]